jgi:hypothetical protein
MDHRDRRAAVHHGDLTLDHHVTDPEPPAGDAVGEVEALDQVMPFRLDRARGPLVGGEAHRRTGGEGHHRIECHQSHMSGRGYVSGHDQQGMVSAGAQAGDCSHGIAAQPVGEQPLSGGTCGKIATDLGAETDRNH